MTTLREAAEKGLRALRVSRIVLMHPDSMAVADAAIAALEAALEQQEKKNPTRQMPEWIDYDSSTDVLTIHGRRYSAAMFGEQGFLSPVGTLLQVAEGQPDCVTLMTVPSKEQPEPEPVAWSVLDKRTKKHWYTNESKYTAQHYANECSHSQPDGSPSMVVTPLYTHPPRRAPEPKPVAWVKIQQGEITHSEMSDGSGCDFDLIGAGFVPLYTHPPRREWRGLTENELGELMRDSCGYPMCPNGDDLAFARAIEAKLKERNA